MHNASRTIIKAFLIVKVRGGLVTIELGKEILLSWERCIKRGIAI